MAFKEEDYEAPSQVNEAAEMAEELFRKMYPEEEAAESETQEEESKDKSNTSDEDEEAEDEDELEEDIEPEEDIKELRKWRDKYLTLRGKYNAEVPRLASQVKDLMEKVSKPAAKEEEIEQEEESNFDSVYGEDFAKQIRKVIDDAVQAKLNPVQEKVNSVEDVQKQAATDSFMSYLDDAAEGWRDLWEGKDKGFQKFLQQKDPMGLNTYAEYIEQFNNNWDADGMAKIFNIYKETKTTTTKPTFSKEQEAMIAPSRAKAANTPASDTKRVWTTESMKQFEADDRQGKYSDADSQAMWADLLSAANEGRIRA